MAETTDTSSRSGEAVSPGLLGRLVGVLFSPHETYAAVAAKPRAFGILVVAVAIIALAQGGFLFTEVGQQAALDQNVQWMERFNVTVTDEMYTQMEAGMSRAPYFNIVSQAIVWPAMATIVAVVLMGIFSMLLGGEASFKQVFATVAHSAVVFAVAQLFAMPLSYARGEFVGASLGVFVPMFDETSFVALFLGAIDLFVIWWAINLAIGLGVLYKRGTGGIATSLIGTYVLIALVVAVLRSGS